ncbi:unnamed protein product [Trifolium pratense]|uniref:Uncharacterized protein n=1 Tax=Trifolium pratense TaxID=57577 RepID=A0ACB0IMJ9_TRIPR|nr:unnamed protein product [Trifolium pratense]
MSFLMAKTDAEISARTSETQWVPIIFNDHNIQAAEGSNNNSVPRKQDNNMIIVENVRAVQEIRENGRSFFSKAPVLLEPTGPVSYMPIQTRNRHVQGNTNNQLAILHTEITNPGTQTEGQSSQMAKNEGTGGIPKKRLRLEGGLEDREGRGGGIAVMWKNSLKCQIMNYSLNHVDIEVIDDSRGMWRLTGFYGFPEGGRRRESWNFLRHLASTSQLPWCIIGDFNDILSSDEKKGRTDRPDWLINGFRDAVVDAGLIDIELVGYPFTWFKSLGTERAVEEKLDRAMANIEWCNLFTHAALECLTTTASDHYPLHLSWVQRDTDNRPPKKFKFENSWLLEPNFKQFMHQTWNSAEGPLVTQKLNNCATSLTKWSAANCQKTRKEIEKYRRKLEVTPLYASVRDDKLVWKLEQDGFYSVRSAYKQCVNDAGYQDRHGVAGQWNNIWHAKIPPKVKNLIWRIGRDVLPTRKKLNSRGVQCPMHCVVCNDGDEDSTHVLFSCTRSIQCWQQAGLWAHISTGLGANNNIAENLFSILHRLNKDQQELFCVLVWSIWKRRNNKVWEDVTDSDQTVVERAKHLITSWRSAQQIRQSAHITQPSPQQTVWTKPRHGRYKCNVDASFSLDRNKVGIGMCLRDDHGRFVAARTEWIEPIVDVEIGEAIGLLYALKWVEGMQLYDTDFEMDCKKIVDSLHSKRTYLSDLGAILMDCRNILASNLVNSDVKFIRRQANEVAHRLAGAATSLASFHNFITIPSSHSNNDDYNTTRKIENGDSQFEALVSELPPLLSILTVTTAFIEPPLLSVNFDGFVCIAAAIMNRTCILIRGRNLISNFFNQNNKRNSQLFIPRFEFHRSKSLNLRFSLTSFIP